MKRLLRIVIAVVVLVPLVIALVYAAPVLTAPQTVNPEDEIVDETRVEQGDLQVIVSGTGALLPQRQVALAFQFTGVVREILVAEGDSVTAGRVLARLDAPELEAAVRDAQLGVDAAQSAYDALVAPPRDVDLAAAKAAVDAAQAGVNAAFATAPTPEQIEIARLQLELARNQLWQLQLGGGTSSLGIPTFTIPQDILDQLPPEVQAILLPQTQSQGASSASSLNQADYGVQIAQANYDAILAQGADPGALASANARLVQAQIAYDRLLTGPDATQVQLAQIDLDTARTVLAQAQAALDLAVLTAPFDGVIADIGLTVGENPPAGPAMVLIDTTNYYVDVAIDETDVVKVQVGQPTALVFDALPDAQIDGRVTRISVTPTIAGQLVTYLVRVTLDPTADPVRVGMTATARIVVNELNDVVLLRNRFIRIDRATQEAFAIVELEDGTFSEVLIVLGLRNDTHSQVVSGLQPGQRVLLLPRGTFNPARPAGGR